MVEMVYKLLFAVLLISCVLIETESKLSCDLQTKSKISIKVDGKTYYVIPQKRRTEFMPLITTDDESKAVTWNIYECGNVVIVKNPDDEKCIWNLKGGCNGSRVVAYPTDDYDQENNQFSIYSLKVCGKCLYRSEAGSVMAAKNCDGKATGFSYK